MTDGPLPQKEQIFSQGSVAEAGTYAVNIRTGELAFERPLFSLDGFKQPMSLSLVYVKNSRYKAGTEYLPTGLPENWRYNFHQSVYKNGNGFVYIDASGNHHPFVKAQTLNGYAGVYFDSTGSGLTMTLYEYIDFYVINGGNGSELCFDGLGRLSKIRDVAANSLTTVTYAADTAVIASVTDGMGRVTSFEGGNITRPDGNQISVTHSPAYLYVKDETVGSSSTLYGISNGLSHALSISGEKVTFDYDAEGRVAKTEYTKNGTALFCGEFVYGNLKTTVRTAKNTLVTSNKDCSTYRFDVKGRCISQSATDNGFTFAESGVKHSDYSRTAYSLKGVSYFEDSYRSDHGPIIEQYVKVKAPKILSQHKKYRLCVHYRHGYNPYSGDPTMEIYLYSDEYFKTLTLDVQDFENDCYADFMPSRDVSVKEMWYVCFSSGLVTVLSDIRIMEIDETTSDDCVNRNTGMPAVIIKESEPMYKLCPLTSLKIDGTVYTGLNFTMADYAANLLNFAKAVNSDKAYYDLWANDKTALIRSVSSVVGTYKNGKSFNVGDIVFYNVTIKDKSGSVSYAERGGQLLRAGSVNYTEYTNDDGETKLAETKSYQDLDNYLRAVKEEKDGIVTYYTYSGRNVSRVESATLDKPDEMSLYYCECVLQTGKYLVKNKNYVNGAWREEISEFDLASGNLLKVTAPSNRSTECAYNAKGFPASVSSGSSGNTLGFSSSNLLSSIGHNGINYGFTYDLRNNPAAVSVNGTAVTTSIGTYGADKDTVTSKYRGTYTERKVFDRYGRLIRVLDGGASGADTPVLTYIYCDNDAEGIASVTDPESAELTVNSQSLLKKVIDNRENVTYNYYYDDKDRLVSVKKDGVETVGYEYGASGILNASTVRTTDSSTRSSYDYDSKGRVALSKAHNSFGCEYKTVTAFDSFDRLSASMFGAGSFDLIGIRLRNKHGRRQNSSFK